MASGGAPAIVVVMFVVVVVVVTSGRSNVKICFRTVVGGIACVGIQSSLLSLLRWCLVGGWIRGKDAGKEVKRKFLVVVILVSLVSTEC